MSKIEVDAITQQSGSTLTVGGGASKTVVADATTVTLGRCGGTVALASGATQSGFGRTGTVDWQTGSIKTATFTAANGEGYFANTSGGAFVMNLPAGTAGNIVSVVDYTNTFQTNNLTVTPNGSQKIGGVAENAVLSTEGQSVTFVYVDDTEGWKNVQGTTDNVIGTTFICASVSGACNAITEDGNFKIATFKGPGTFTVNSVSTDPTQNSVDYLVVAGGGGAGQYYAGGGGAGGYRESPGTTTCYTASPLGASPATAITVTATGFPITVGGGGAGSGGSPSSPSPSCNGVASTFSTITSAGGGGGGGGNPGTYSAQPGGSGGGGGQGSGVGGTGNTPPVNPPQGNPGGNSPSSGGSNGGGGGAGAAGASSAPGPGALGGVGVGTGINPAPGVGTPGPSGPLRYFAGGGTSQGTPSTPIVGGGGGGGNSGTVNTGGGGSGDNGNGGSGIVIIRYKFQ